MERRKRYSADEAKTRLYAYCAYQERSHQEVRRKLYSLGVHGEPAGQIIADLITAGYLNEERFARAFAGGKFRIKGWGRVKIRRELEAHGVTRNCIRSGMEEIDEAEYRKALERLLWKKAPTLGGDHQREKLARYAIGKGFEPELVWKTVDGIVGDGA